MSKVWPSQAIEVNLRDRLPPLRLVTGARQGKTESPPFVVSDGGIETLHYSLVYGFVSSTRPILVRTSP
jgi:hypothetical protein